MTPYEQIGHYSSLGKWPNFALCIYVNGLSIADCLEFLSFTPDAGKFVHVKRGVEDYEGKTVVGKMVDGRLQYSLEKVKE